MKLYTSLRHAKMALNGGVMPMTPLPPDTPSFINPAFTIDGGGMGGLVEHETKGIRCPICGVYDHYVGRHFNKHHAAIGGASAVRQALSLPHTAALVSTRVSEKKSAAAKAAWARGAWGDRRTPSTGGLSRSEMATRAARSKSEASRTMGKANLATWCRAQIMNKILDLQQKLGHAPSLGEFELEYGQCDKHVNKVFGSWNAAKASLKLELYTGRTTATTAEYVYDILREFSRVHGRLPMQKEARGGGTVPVLPNFATILRALGIKSWPLAMQVVAEALSIDDPRYNVPAA